MCANLALQKVFSGEMAQRRFFLRPPEPSPEILISSPSQSVYIGRTSFLKVPFFWNPAKFINPHLCVVGITGSGKSYFIKTFITRANLTFGTNALILDWAGEYSDWVKAAGGKVVVFGTEGINLLELGGATPHARTRQIMEALQLLTDLAQFPAQRRITEDAIEEAYITSGFSLHEAKKGKAAPTLEKVQKILEKKAKKNVEVAEAARRIKNLLMSSGGSFCKSTIKLEELLTGLVCVDLHTLPMESLRSLAGLAVLQFVKEKMRAQSYTSVGAPKLFIVVDEAWKIAADERSDVVSIVREGRKYGFGLIVASQNPTDVHKSIFSNAGTVMSFRLTSGAERDYVRSSLSYSDFFEQQTHFLSVGQALVHLEIAIPVSCPRNFILQKVDGEELMVVLAIRGEKLNLEFERGEMVRRLLSFGLNDKQTKNIVEEFERHSYSLEVGEFVSSLEKLGYPKAAIISLLREFGAGERELLSLFATGTNGGQSGRSGQSGRREEEIVVLAREQTAINEIKKTKKSKVEKRKQRRGK